MDAAARLFAAHGYQAVSMEDIGAAAGISGAGIYNHVTAKSDLLVAALTRAADAPQLDASRAFATATSPRHALDLLLRSYIDLTVNHSHLTGTLITEVIHLPAEQRHAIRRLQHDYVSEWVHLLTIERPELTEAEARVVVHAVFTTINDLARIDHPRERADLSGDLFAVCRALLLAHTG
ncbi:TetR family transcriptional regulator [Nonomuraea sp. NPDC048916]|uniref:TetR/AcrR family transcriptional regulator n=1 Tax=Nonomuraea sp. NPDC048916 TaxID=3154232 RepID=UPI0033EF139A